MFDKCLGRAPSQLDKNESSNWEFESLVEGFPYSSLDPRCIEFAVWLESVLSSHTLLNKANDFIELERKRKTEPIGQKRTELVNLLSRINDG